MKEKKAYWIGGTMTAFLGVALLRLLSPELGGVAGWVAGAAGYLLVVVGLATLVCATRRKKAEAFITIEEKARD
jgi:protein-S-isoprenylcysteine O-methyltransferase Ste14